MPQAEDDETVAERELGDKASRAVAGSTQTVTLTPKEVEKLLRMSRATVSKAIQRGDIPSVKIGRRRIILREELFRVLRGESKAGSRAA